MAILDLTRYTTTASAILTLLFCKSAQAGDNLDSVCAKLAESHIRSTADSTEFQHAYAMQEWSKCEKMNSVSEDESARKELRKQIRSGKVEAEYMAFSASVAWSDEDLSSDESFSRAMKRESKEACGESKSLSDFEKRIAMRGTDYYDTSEKVVECVRALRDQPIVFTPGASQDAAASFSIGVRDATAILVQVVYDKSAVRCTAYNGKEFGSSEFCAARPPQEQKSCTNNEFAITANAPLAGQCVAIREDLPALTVHVMWSGRNLAIPVPLKRSQQGQKTEEEAARLRRELSSVIAQRDTALKEIQDNLKTTQTTLETLKGRLAKEAMPESNFCVLSPVWNACPAGFGLVGNFFACFQNGMALGIDAAGVNCAGPYDDRHVNVCCR